MTDLWGALGIQPPESSEVQNYGRRVVLVGHATSGKRTIAVNLRAAVQQQQQHQFSTFNAAPSAQSVAPSNGASAAAVLGSRTVGGSNGKGVSSSFRRANIGLGSPTGSTGGRVALDSVDLPACHGAGVAHTYASLRLPASLLALPGSNLRRTMSTASYAGTESPTPESSVASVSTGTGIPLQAAPANNATSSPSGPLRKITTEFFCCDCADALWVALPTLEALESCVIIFVVDLAEAERMQEQLKEWRTAVHEHVLAVMKLFAPKQDEVRRMRMVEGAQRFWESRRRALEQLSESKWRDHDEKDVAASSGMSAGFAGAKEGDVGLAALGCEKVCALPSIVIFNKFDLLERAAKEVIVKATMKGQPLVAASSDSPDPGALTIAASQLIAIVGDQQQQQQSVLSIATQFLRKEAMCMNSAFATLGSRVNFASGASASATSGSGVGRPGGVFNGNQTADGSSKNPNSTILTRSLRSDGSSTETDAPSRARGARMYPSSFGEDDDDARAGLSKSSNEDSVVMADSGTSEGELAERSFAAKDRRQRLSSRSGGGQYGGTLLARQGGLAPQSTVLVHPVYKALWSYIFQLLYGQLTLATSASPRGALASAANMRGSSPAVMSSSINGDAASLSLRNDDENVAHDTGNSQGRRSSLQNGVRATSSPSTPASLRLSQNPRLPEDVENASTFVVGQQGFLPHGMDSPRYLDRMVLENNEKCSAYDRLFMLRRLTVNHLLGIQDDEAELILSTSGSVGASKSTLERWPPKKSGERGTTTLERAGVKMHDYYLEQMTAALQEGEVRDTTGGAYVGNATTSAVPEPVPDVMVWDEFA